MRILIAEDHEISRDILKLILSEFGDCDVVVDGEEAVLAFETAWEELVPYDLICMDIMMPHINGIEALAKMRALEKEWRIPASEQVKVIMTTALQDPKTVVDSFTKGGAAAYMVKPITKDRLVEEMEKLGLIMPFQDLSNA